MAAGSRSHLLVIPAALFASVVILYPLAALVAESFGAHAPFDNYQRFFVSPVYLRVMQRTLTLSALTTLICLAIGYPFAYRLATATTRGRALLMIVILVPFWTNLLVRTYGWMILLNPRGVVNTMLLDAGLIGSPLELVYNQTGVLIGMVQIMLPYMILPISAVMSRFDPQLTRASRSLGASPLATFRHVYLPATLPGVMAGVLLVFAITLGFFVIPAILGGARELLLAQLIEFNVNTTLDWGFAATIATMLLAVTFTLYAVALRWFGLGAIWGMVR
ncbi:MAG TPA: ABC transporter permease [Xanthobacteraceae bacterium]|nr:ABC transporter permease [Xanthobacteraceae bacterium]